MPDHPHSPDPDKLRALAEAASEGPWVAEDRGGDPYVFQGAIPGGRRCPVLMSADGSREERTANAAYIAAANPTAILALLARLESAEGALKTALEILEASPELNMSNYDHDQVAELNAAVCEAVLFLRAASAHFLKHEGGE